MSRFLTHYIGRIYGAPRFVAEAKEKGIQRAISYVQLKTLHFDQNVVVASYETKIVKNGLEAEALVFGMFPIEGFAILCPSGNMVEVDTSGGVNVSRVCGNYTVVREDKTGLPLAEALDKAIAATHLTPADCKFFVTSSGLKVLDSPLIIRNAMFARGFFWCELPLMETKGTDSHKIVYLADYNKRSYVKKDVLDSIDKELIEAAKMK